MADHRLEPLKKSDLQFNYPLSVTQGDDPSKRNSPDSDLLNRSEWYEVLYMSNKFANTHNVQNMTKAEIAKKAERLIKQYLPGDVRSHDNVTAWLVDNWTFYGSAPFI